MIDLFIRSILYDGKNSVVQIDTIMRSEIAESGYAKLKENFSPKDISAFILGSYFGLIFQKFINKEAFNDRDETNDKIQKFINFLKDQEDIKHE